MTDPDQPGGSSPDTPDSDEDAAWRAIVENYGERPDFVEPPPPPGPTASPSASLERLFQPWRAEEWDAEDATARERPGDDAGEDLEDPEDAFVPPPTPPLPRPSADRLIAWIGLFGAPVALLVVLLGHLPVPGLVTWGLGLWFLGGFGYLVAQMPREPRDPWDDGAQV